MPDNTLRCIRPGVLITNMHASYIPVFIDTDSYNIVPLDYQLRQANDRCFTFTLDELTVRVLSRAR